MKHLIKIIGICIIFSEIVLTTNTTNLRKMITINEDTRYNDFKLIKDSESGDYEETVENFNSTGLCKDSEYFVRCGHRCPNACFNHDPSCYAAIQCWGHCNCRKGYIRLIRYYGECITEARCAFLKRRLIHSLSNNRKKLQENSILHIFKDLNFYEKNDPLFQWYIDEFSNRHKFKGSLRD